MFGLSTSGLFGLMSSDVVEVTVEFAVVGDLFEFFAVGRICLITERAPLRSLGESVLIIFCE